MSITKNRLCPSALHALCSAAFPQRQVSSITELTEGMFNAAYRIDFADGGASVLKIAAADPAGLMSNEINLMQAEVTAMELAQQHGLPHVARVQHVDFTRSICSGWYFFMECLPGRSLNACRSELSEGTLQHIHADVGRFQRQMTGVTGDCFGLLGDKRRFTSLAEMMHSLFENVLHDASAHPVDLPFSAGELLAQLDADQAIFSEVQTPSLVHWDMWEGNIFIHDGELCGVIDWERAMWGDPLMDDRFRRHTRSAAFLEGFGQREFSTAEMRRLAWYDLFLYITMMTECFFRQYEDISGLHAWLRPLLEAAWRDIR